MQFDASTVQVDDLIRGSLGASGRLRLAGQLGIREPFARYLGDGQDETAPIVQWIILCCPVIVSKNLFIHVTVKVKRLNGYIRAGQSTIQETPKIVNSLRVNLSINLFFHVVYGFMDEKVMV
jgi:hypothetical protein